MTELRDQHNRQAAELEIAYNEIDRLDAAIIALQDAAKREATAAADRKLSLISLEQENALLRARLDATLGDLTETTNRLLAVESAFNDRETVISTAFEDVDLLNAKLQAQSVEIERQAAAFEVAEQRHGQEINRLKAMTDDQARKLGALYCDQSAQHKAREKLAKRCEELSNTAAELEDAQRKLAAHAEHTAFLEIVLRVERDTSEATIGQLTEELAQQRMERIAADEASRAMRVQIAALLLQLMERRQLSLVAAGDVLLPPAQAAA